MQIAPTFIFALLMSTAALGKSLKTSGPMPTKTSRMRSQTAVTRSHLLTKATQKNFEAAQNAASPGSPCGCELFDVTIVSEGPSLVRVDLYGEYSYWFDFYTDYGYPPLLVYGTYDQGLDQFSSTYQGGSSPADLSTRYLYFQDRFTFQLQLASIASAEIELISGGDKFVPGDFDGDGDHDIDDYNAGAALGLCAADANRDVDR